jgi:hypothetical protein
VLGSQCLVRVQNVYQTSTCKQLSLLQSIHAAVKPLFPAPSAHGVFSHTTSFLMISWHFDGARGIWFARPFPSPPRFYLACSDLFPVRSLDTGSVLPRFGFGGKGWRWRWLGLVSWAKATKEVAGEHEELGHNI